MSFTLPDEENEWPSSRSYETIELALKSLEIIFECDSPPLTVFLMAMNQL